jgi:hypothetical protein
MHQYRDKLQIFSPKLYNESTRQRGSTKKEQKETPESMESLAQTLKESKESVEEFEEWENSSSSYFGIPSLFIMDFERVEERDEEEHTFFELLIMET